MQASRMNFSHFCLHSSTSSVDWRAIPFPGILIESWFLSPPSKFSPLCLGFETSIYRESVCFSSFLPSHFHMSPVVQVIFARPSGPFDWWMITLLMCTTALNSSGRFKHMKNTRKIQKFVGICGCVQTDWPLCKPPYCNQCVHMLSHEASGCWALWSKVDDTHMYSQKIMKFGQEVCTKLINDDWKSLSNRMQLQYGQITSSTKHRLRPMARPLGLSKDT